jgi:hypothetical protein
MRYYVIFLLLPLIFLFKITSAEVISDVNDSQKIKIIFPDGSKYIGRMKDGKRHGQGRFISADGSEYRGEFKDGEPYGKGIYIYADGRRKQVIYDRGRMIEARFLDHGITKKGCIYGEFVSLGRYTGWFKGNRIKGYVPHGRGIMRYFNGSIYTGQWWNGKMHGNGVIRWDDSSSYAGQWFEGKRTGYGTYTWPNGDTYIGKWNENQMCGIGIYYHHDGRVQKGIWKEKIVRVNE